VPVAEQPHALPARIFGAVILSGGYMKFATEDKGTWFYFEDNEKKGGVKLRTLLPKDFKSIQKRTQKKNVKYRGDQRHEWVETNTDLEQSLTWDHCIIEWEGVEDKNGKALTCNQENKAMLMESSMQFLSFITEKLEMLNNDQLGLDSELEKN